MLRPDTSSSGFNSSLTTAHRINHLNADQGNSAGEIARYTIYPTWDQPLFKMLNFNGFYHPPDGSVRGVQPGSGSVALITAAVDGFSLYYAAGNIASGQVIVEKRPT